MFIFNDISVIHLNGIDDFSLMALFYNAMNGEIVPGKTYLVRTPQGKAGDFCLDEISEDKGNYEFRYSFRPVTPASSIEVKIEIPSVKSNDNNSLQT